MDDALDGGTPRRAGPGLPAALGGRRRRVRRRRRPPAPDPARATPTRSLRFHARASPSAPATCATSGRTRTISPRDLERFTVVDHHDRVAFVCLLGGEIIAVGRYEGMSGPDGIESSPAEVAFVVARRPPEPRARLDPARAPRRGRPGERACAASRPRCWRENRQMVRVFRDAGYQVSRSSPTACCTSSSTSTPPSARSRCATPASSGPRRAACTTCCTRVGRGDRRVHRPVEDRPRGAGATCCAATSPARSTRSTRRPAPCAACARTRRSPTSRTRSTSPWSRCRRPGSTT